MANIYTYYPTEWTYHNVTRLSDYSFKFEGVGAYATTTIVGREFGVLGSDLYIRGNVSPSQENLTQGLCCRLDMYSKQEDEEYWEIEKHFIYLKGDKNGAINQKITTIGGFFGFFDHIDIRLEVLSDSELSVEDTIELTSFVIDDPTLNGELPAIKDTLTRHEIDLNKYGLELTEILGTEEEDGRLDIAEKNVATLEAKQLVFTETLTTGGLNLLDNATYGGREAPDASLWCADDTVCYVMARLVDMTIDVIDYPIMGQSVQGGAPTYLDPSFLTPTKVKKIDLFSITDGDSILIQDELSETGILTRRIGVHEYTGGEDWNVAFHANGNFVYYLVRPEGAKTQGIIMSSHAEMRQGEEDANSNRVYLHANGNIDFYFDSSQTRSLKAFKEYLSESYNRGRPLTVYFELNAPKIETVAISKKGDVFSVIGDLTINEVLDMEW